MSDLGYPMTLAHAGNWSAGRGGNAIVWVVVHCTDAPYQDDYPTQLGTYWARVDVEVSTHYGVSDTEVHQYVAHADAAYSARDPANARGVHIEFAGLSAWTRAEWLAHDAMLVRGALLITQVAAAHGIPVGTRLLTAGELHDRATGLTCHADLTKAFTGTHTDPGPGFPWDRLFELFEHLATAGHQQEDDMFNDSDRATLENVGWTLGVNKGQVPEHVRDATEVTTLAALSAQVTALSTQVTALAAQFTAFATASRSK